MISDQSLLLSTIVLNDKHTAKCTTVEELEYAPERQPELQPNSTQV